MNWIWETIQLTTLRKLYHNSGHYSTENWNSALHLRKARKCILEIANHIKYNITKLQTSSFLFAKNTQFPNIPGRKIHKVYIACKPISKANQDLSCGEKKPEQTIPLSESWFQSCLKNYLSFGYSSIFVTKRQKLFQQICNSNFLFKSKKITKYIS